MSRRIELSNRAVADLDDLGRRVRERVIVALERFAESREGDVIKLHGRGNEWRLRVGDWRVVLEIDNEASIVYVIRVLHRREAYR